MFGTHKSNPSHTHGAQAPAPQRRNAWMHGNYRLPVWIVTGAMGASIYLRYFMGTPYDQMHLFGQIMVNALPIAIACVSALYAYTIYRSDPDANISSAASED